MALLAHFSLEYCGNVVHELLAKVEQNHVTYNDYVRNMGVVNKKGKVFFLYVFVTCSLLPGGQRGRVRQVWQPLSQ